MRFGCKNLLSLGVVFFIWMAGCAQEQEVSKIKDSRKPINLSKEKSAKLSQKMLVFLSIMGDLSEALQKKDFKVMQIKSRELVELTRFKKKEKSVSVKDSTELEFMQMKKALGRSIFKLNKSVQKEDINRAFKNYTLTLRACYACHSTFKKADFKSQSNPFLKWFEVK